MALCHVDQSAFPVTQKALVAPPPAPLLPPGPGFLQPRGLCTCCFLCQERFPPLPRGSFLEAEAQLGAQRKLRAFLSASGRPSLTTRPHFLHHMTVSYGLRGALCPRGLGWYMAWPTVPTRCLHA